MIFFLFLSFFLYLFLNSITAKKYSYDTNVINIVIDILSLPENADQRIKKGVTELWYFYNNLSQEIWICFGIGNGKKGANDNNNCTVKSDEDLLENEQPRAERFAEELKRCKGMKVSELKKEFVRVRDFLEICSRKIWLSYCSSRRMCR